MKKVIKRLIKNVTFKFKLCPEFNGKIFLFITYNTGKFKS